MASPGDVMTQPPLPRPLSSTGPFVGREDPLGRVERRWHAAVGGVSGALMIGGEPGVGKTRLSAECARRAHEAGAIVLYGACDEELTVPLKSFIDAVRPLVPVLGAGRLRAVRGIDKLARLVSELAEILPTDDVPSPYANADTERLALFDAVTALLVTASVQAPVMFVLDDLHWAGKTTLSLLRHLLRNTGDARLLVVGTYRDTELRRSDPFAHTLADLRGDDAAERIILAGLPPEHVAAYLAAVGNRDEALGRELARVTAGNPYFLIETLRHVDTHGGAWRIEGLPDELREAIRLRLSTVSPVCAEALSVAAVAGMTFDIVVVERVLGADLLDAVDEALAAGLVVEEAGTTLRLRFTHTLVRDVLLAEQLTAKRLRLHRAIAEALEADERPGRDDERLAELAHHWFEYSVVGDADKAVEACAAAAERAVARLAYEDAADLFGMAVTAIDRGGGHHLRRGELLIARCEAHLAAGDLPASRAAVEDLHAAAQTDRRLHAWHSIYSARLDLLASSAGRSGDLLGPITAAASALGAMGDHAGAAEAQHVHAVALQTNGQFRAAEQVLVEALATVRRSGDRRLNDDILGEVPVVALWGPAPISEAAGRCLDVWRLLRLTADAPAVESIAVRCLAVIEALRGRFATARDMVRAAHATVDRLGLTRQRLEVAIDAATVELLDGDAIAAEQLLRTAHNELVRRGLETGAARAAALLAQALLEQQRLDEAVTFAGEAAVTGGADLRTQIVWRCAAARAAGLRGEWSRALELADEAVAVAATTDSLLLIGDAHQLRATLTRARDPHGAASEDSARALAAYRTKGATALVRLVESAATTRSLEVDAPTRSTRPTAEREQRGLDTRQPRDHDELDTAFARYVRAQSSELPAATSATPIQPPRFDQIFENASVRGNRRCDDAWNRGDWQAMLDALSPSYRVNDRRALVGEPLAGPAAIENLRLIFEAGASYETGAVLATRGERLHLGMRTLRMSGEVIATWLAIIEVDDHERKEVSVMLDLDDVDGADRELDRRYLEGEGASHATLLRSVATYVRLCNGDHPLDRFSEITTEDFAIAGTQDVGAAIPVAPPGSELRLEHLRVSTASGLFVLVGRDVVADDEPVRRVVVFTHRDGRFKTFEFFDQLSASAAMARWAQLATPYL